MKKLMAANWKMYKTRSEAKETIRALAKNLDMLTLDDDIDVVVFPAFTSLTVCAEAMLGTRNLFLGAQDVYPAKEGAFTGEISPLMLLDCACRFVLVGHSERRHIMGESNALVAQKASYAFESGLDVILCVGETLAEREAGKLEFILTEQLGSGLAGFNEDFEPARLCIAYEPVWAIGTGKVAGSVEIVEAHKLIRTLLTRKFAEKAQQIRILYGGSVKVDNIDQIIGLDNVDGVLVGGASLDAENFTQIVFA